MNQIERSHAVARTARPAGSPRRQRPPLRAFRGSAGALLLALSLVVFASGCKKKVPPPAALPPAPAPAERAPSNKPAINSFTAEPSTIERGQAVTLRWSVSNATDVSIDHGMGAVQSSGQRQATPSATTTYTLTANGPGGSDTRSVTVELSTPPPPPSSENSRTPSLSGAEMLQQQGEDAYFDYNKFDIRPDASAALTHNAELLRRILTQDPSFNAAVEGHCDERGSAEYNVALGDKRASAAREFLVQRGVPGDRLRSVSYGKERPQCTDASEECYQKNRRAHLSPGQ